jgi:hypothetical protein
MTVEIHTVEELLSGAGVADVLDPDIDALLDGTVADGPSEDDANSVL